MKILFSVHNFDKMLFQPNNNNSAPANKVHLAGPVNKFILVRKIISHSEFEVAPYPEIIVKYYLIPMPNFMLLSQCAQFSCCAAGLNRGENQTLAGAIPFCGEHPGPRFEDKFR